LSYTDYGGALLFPRDEASQEITDFNALVKQSVERLSPLLGHQTRLRLYSRYGPFPVALRSSQIEGILSRLFAHATEQMESGGTVSIGTADFRVPGYDSNSQQETATHAVLVFKCPGSRNACLQTTVPSQVSSDSETDCFSAMRQDLDSLIKKSMGFLTLDHFYPDTVIRIYFPVVNLPRR
jgi:hypothetical protein